MKSQGQPACQEDKKKCKEGSVNAVHDSNVDNMYDV
jgi:hypothetical protein